MTTLKPNAGGPVALLRIGVEGGGKRVYKVLIPAVNCNCLNSALGGAHGWHPNYAHALTSAAMGGSKRPDYVAVVAFRR